MVQAFSDSLCHKLYERLKNLSMLRILEKSDDDSTINLNNAYIIMFRCAKSDSCLDSIHPWFGNNQNRQVFSEQEELYHADCFFF